MYKNNNTLHYYSEFTIVGCQNYRPVHFHFNLTKSDKGNLPFSPFTIQFGVHALDLRLKIISKMLNVLKHLKYTCIIQVECNQLF